MEEMSMSRRTLLSSASIAAAGTLASPAILHWPANAAEFGYKYGTALPDGHPMVIRSKEAATKIKRSAHLLRVVLKCDLMPRGDREGLIVGPSGSAFNSRKPMRRPQANLRRGGAEQQSWVWRTDHPRSRAGCRLGAESSHVDGAIISTVEFYLPDVHNALSTDGGYDCQG
jgi:hypothetical protein